MVNWTDHGIIGGVKDPYKTFKWADGVNAWAPQVIFRNGKFYLYGPFPKGGHMVIGVAVADKPEGPFVDALGAPLINNPNSTDDIDPTVFIDDDGQAYLYWGHQPPTFYVKLNADMISYSGSIVQLTKPQTYEEGPWFYKRNSHYYLAFASTCCPEGIGYAMSDSATGPWTYKGSIMDGSPNSSGNHPGIIDYKGNSYVFGFDYFLNNNLTNGVHHERRSVCVDKLTYAADGTIAKLPWWSKTGVEQISNLNPYVRTEAETMAWTSGGGTSACTNESDYNNCWKWGVRTEATSDTGGGIDVTSVQDGAYIKVAGVDFGTGAVSFSARVASDSNGGKIELHLDSVTGTTVGTLIVTGTGGAQTWVTQTTTVTGATGVHDLYFKLTGTGAGASGSLFNFNYWQFTPKDTIDAGAGVDAADGAGGSGGAGPGGSGGAQGGAGGTSAGGSGSDGGRGGAQSGGTGAGGSNTSGVGGRGGSQTQPGGSGAGGILSAGGGTTSSGGQVQSAGTGAGGTVAAGGGRISAGGQVQSGGSGAGGIASPEGGTSSSGGSGGPSGNGGAAGGPGGAAGGSAGATTNRSSSSGCSCALGPSGRGRGLLELLLGLGVIGLHRRTRRHRSRVDSGQSPPVE